jgi:enoyl-CoA hydratase/carnithine racemase
MTPAPDGAFADAAPLEIERGPDRALMRLNRPARRNALSVALRDAVSDALDLLAVDEAVKAVVVTGAGDVFSSGFDLREFDRAAADDAFMRALWASSDRFHRTVLCFPLPIVAAVNGPAVAGGFDLAVMCDMRLASTTARFAHPERSFGEVVYGPLAALVGGAVARELTLGGREVTAEEALALNLVGEVVEPTELMARTDVAVDRICVAPRDVLVRIKAKALRHAGVDPTIPTLDL